MKPSLAVLLLPFSLLAADFWLSKPYTDWNEKDIQKILNDSPWAHRVTVEMPAGGRGGPAGPAGLGGADTGGFSGGGRGGGATTGVAEASSSGGGGGGGRGRGGGPQGGADQEPVTPLAQAASVTISWRSALPFKQALMKAKYGSEVTTSPEAKALMEREEKFYVVVLSGLPAAVAGSAAAGGVDLKQIMMEQSTLSVKGKDPIHPSDVQIGRQGLALEAYLLFPRTTAFNVDDKEVELTSKIQRMTIRNKFRLKDMMFNNKLEL